MTGCQPRHRRIPLRMILAVVGMLAWGPLLPHATASAQSNDDYDCNDFDTQQDAQAFYEANGGPLYDPFNLDSNQDGTACEEWKRYYERAAAGEDGINGQDGIDMDCADFKNQNEAQRYFENDGGSTRNDVDHLDTNHNGVACEHGEPG
jgi:hypothetical protein